MRETNWRKRATSFKRHIRSALAKATTRLRCQVGYGATYSASEQADDRTAASIPEERSEHSPPPPRSRSIELEQPRSVSATIPAPPPTPVEQRNPCETLPTCQPDSSGATLPPAEHVPRIDDECLAGMFARSAAYAPQPDLDDQAPHDESILARLAPACSVEATGIWLPETHKKSPESIPLPSVSWTSHPPSLPESLSEVDESPSQHLIAIADSENVVTPVIDTLHYAGVIKKNGKLKRKVVRSLQIVHTGDMILKHQPDPGVVDYWLELGEQVEQLGGKLVLLAGNHELEIWDCLQQGQRLGMKRRQSEQVQTFIRKCQLFHVSGSAMFIHGYPTLNLLRDLKRFQERTGLSIDHYHEQCFRRALDDPGELTQYRYLRGKGARKLLLHDLDDPGRYYRTHGKDVAALLRYFGIEQVVHGHRPERSGIQADYEFRRWLPGIRMIGNDTQLRQRGLGAVIMRMECEGATDVLMVNTKTSGNDQRKLVKEMLRKKAPRRPCVTALDISRGVAATEARQVSDNRAAA